jgi:hypothetical protein
MAGATTFAVDHSVGAFGRSYDVNLGGDDASFATKAAVGLVAAVNICQCEIIWRVVSIILMVLATLLVATSIVLACVVNPLFALGVIPAIALGVWGAIQCSACPELSLS